MERLGIETPAFIFDLGHIASSCKVASRICRDAGAKLLYSLKAASHGSLLRVISEQVDGFSASSVFEAQLVRDVVGRRTRVHITSPGIRDCDLEGLAIACDRISLNSLSQLRRFAPALNGGVELGLRINPELSFLDDERYDPCRSGSKLGTPIGTVRQELERDPSLFESISGLLVHNNCESEDFSHLRQTVERISSSLPDLLERLDWLNLGGGYIFDGDTTHEEFAAAVAILQDRYGLEVLVEPGMSLVRDGVILVASVTDIFDSGGARLAVLDTSVCHMPEIFEYQYRPRIIGHVDGAPHRYVLAGCTCLAGDIFGEHAFTKPLKIGDQVTFAEMGAYTLVKAHRFNGVNLPSIYEKSADGHLNLAQRFTYDDYARQNGVTVRTLK
jgi:carboxynorspermidine decarboxylase